jgi:hypothetical protein
LAVAYTLARRGLLLWVPEVQAVRPLGFNWGLSIFGTLLGLCSRLRGAGRSREPLFVSVSGGGASHQGDRCRSSGGPVSTGFGLLCARNVLRRLQWEKLNVRASPERCAALEAPDGSLTGLLLGIPSWPLRRPNARRSARVGGVLRGAIGYLVDSASSHMLVSKIKPCKSKYKQLYRETANGSLNQLSFI